MKRLDDILDRTGLILSWEHWCRMTEAEKRAHERSADRMGTAVVWAYFAGAVAMLAFLVVYLSLTL